MPTGGDAGSHKFCPLPPGPAVSWCETGLLPYQQWTVVL